VALGAVGGEAGRLVIRVGGSLVLRQVAAHAVGREALVQRPDVAGGAGHRAVCAEEREARVVEAPLVPRESVASGTARKSVGNAAVTWFGLMPLVVGEVAVQARRWQPGVHVPAWHVEQAGVAWEPSSGHTE